MATQTNAIDLAEELRDIRAEFLLKIREVVDRAIEFGIPVKIRYSGLGEKALCDQIIRDKKLSKGRECLLLAVSHEENVHQSHLVVKLGDLI